MSLGLLLPLVLLVGYYIGSIPHEIEIGIEGLAAGAMLTMIAQTMIPEAVHRRHQSGGACHTGRLPRAVAFKVFE